MRQERASFAGLQANEGATYRIAVLLGKLFSDAGRITSKIREDADRRGFTKPHPEVACLTREKLSDQELEAMGFWWLVTMHEPIKDSGGVPYLLSAYRGVEGRELLANYDRPSSRWSHGVGFAFVAS
ncbi:MAG: hypothetical protein U9Q03_05250 [Patescibacteria group bacterium]|nr:hypothetical protein [Patescibacteria group bacterium]